MKETYYLDELDLKMNKHHFWIYKKHKIIFGFDFSITVINKNDNFRKIWIAVTLIDMLNKKKVKEHQVKRVDNLFSNIVIKALKLEI